MQISFKRFSEAQTHVILVGTIALLFAIVFSSCERVQKPIMTAETHDTSETTALTILGGTPGGSFSPFAAAVSAIATQGESSVGSIC